MLPGYQLMSEHEHSNSLLIANEKVCAAGCFSSCIVLRRLRCSRQQQRLLFFEGRVRGRAYSVVCTRHAYLITLGPCTVATNECAQQSYKHTLLTRHMPHLLFASLQFLIDGRWHTWIDYDRFHSLLQSGKHFTAMDYHSPTPEWAVYGAKERGFDPIEVRHHRKKPMKNVHGC